MLTRVRLVLLVAAVAAAAVAVVSAAPATPAAERRFSTRMAQIIAEVQSSGRGLWVPQTPPVVTSGDAAPPHGDAAAGIPAAAAPAAARERRGSTWSCPAGSSTCFDMRTAYSTCLSPVRNQGSCGSCWAFASSSLLADLKCASQGLSAPLELSPQRQINCCSSASGCSGCDGATLYGAARSIISPAGTKHEACIPYLGASGLACASTCSPDTPWYLSGGTDFTSYQASTKAYVLSNTDAMRYYVSLGFPLLVGMTVYEDFTTYESGVYEHVTGRVLGGHAVEIVGYGTEGSTQFWVVRNSWGNGFGEGGYFRIKAGECGIDDNAILFFDDSGSRRRRGADAAPPPPGDGVLPDGDLGPGNKPVGNINATSLSDTELVAEAANETILILRNDRAAQLLADGCSAAVAGPLEVKQVISHEVQPVSGVLVRLLLHVHAPLQSAKCQYHVSVAAWLAPDLTWSVLSGGEMTSVSDAASGSSSSSSDDDSQRHTLVVLAGVGIAVGVLVVAALSVVIFKLSSRTYAVERSAAAGADSDYSYAAATPTGAHHESELSRPLMMHSLGADDDE